MYLTNRKLLACQCAVIETWMTQFSSGKMPSESTRRSKVYLNCDLVQLTCNISTISIDKNIKFLDVCFGEFL